MAGRALYAQCERVWATMVAEAVPPGQLRGRDRFLAGMVPVGCMGIWIGGFIDLMKGLGIPSTAQYHQVKGALVQMGTIAQLRRGAGYTPSAWALLRQPSEELWEARIGPLGRRYHGREVALREQHEQALAEFLARPPESEELRQVVRVAGARNGAELVAFLAALPPQRQRALGLPCLANHVVGAVHTCGWEVDDQAAELLAGELEQATAGLAR